MRNLWNILLILVAGCASQKPQAVVSVPAAIMPPLPVQSNAKAAPMMMTMVSPAVVAPPKIRTLTLAATSPCLIQMSSDLVTWTDYGFCRTNLTVTNLLSVAMFRAVSRITLAWDNSPDLTVAGYRIYAGQSSRNYTRAFDAGQTNTFLCPGWFGTNYFAATAYDAYGVESDFSNEASCVAAPPALTLK
jgi:hypothetical protein